MSENLRKPSNKKMSQVPKRNNSNRPSINTNNRVRIQLSGENHRTLINRLIEHLRAAGVVRDIDYTPWNQQSEDSSFVYMTMISSNHASGMIRNAGTFRNVKF